MIRKIRKTRRNENRSRRFESRSLRRRFNESEESDVLYTAKDAWFRSEETTYEEGDIGGGTEWVEKLNLESNTLEGLFDKIQEKLYMNADDERFYWSVQLSDMNGWTSFECSYLADENNYFASDRHIEDWKNGNETLWDVYCSVIVEKTVKASNVPDEEMEALADKLGLDVQ